MLYFILHDSCLLFADDHSREDEETHADDAKQAAWVFIVYVMRHVQLFLPKMRYHYFKVVFVFARFQWKRTKRKIEENEMWKNKKDG